MRIKKSFLLLALFWVTSFFAQELPPIIKYSPKMYGAGNQNWMISQDQNHYLYFANNEGLLTFDGSKWDLYPSPNETIIRSVKSIGNRVYTGCYMEFGYWLRQKNGRLQYTSLSKDIKNKIQDDEQFWNILHYDHWIIFQSLHKIFIYDSKKKSFKVIAPKSGILKSFKNTNGIFYQTVSNGLYEIVSGKESLVSDDPILKNNKIINVFAIDQGLLIQTQWNGFYKLFQQKISRFVTDVDDKLKAKSSYTNQQLSDGSLAIGTVSDGVYVIDSNGKLKHHISKKNGLSNNTALSLFEDVDKNLWIGLDFGINCINLQSPIKSFTDSSGILGTIYTTKLFNGQLFIGTNQGLFYKEYYSNEDFKFISGTKGQVWSLFEYNGELFCGHDSGSFLIQNGTAIPIFNSSGTWKFSPVPNRKDLLLQGNYYGISVLQKVNNQWVFKNKVAGFDYSAKSFEITTGLEVYISHEYKGIFRLKLNQDLTKATSFVTYASPQKGKNASLIKFHGNIYYAYKEGVFTLQPKTKQFVKDTALSAIFNKGEYTSGRMIVSESNKLWLFTKNYIHYFTLSKLSNQLKDNVIPIPASLTNSMLGYENCTQLSNTTYLIGNADGYYTLNMNDLSFKNYKVAITDIAVNSLNEGVFKHSIKEKGKFKYLQNNIAFNFTVPEYNKYINTEYQYVLKGFQEQWSPWSSKSFMNYKNLPPGDYVFKVRAKFSNTLIENTAVYSFTILKPWYFTNLALFLYVVLFFVMAFYINKAYRNYYEKQEAKLIEENNRLLEIKELENEQELMRLRNEQLSQDVDSINRELAVSTMSLNSKNELLAFIKEDLKKTDQGNTSNIKSVISTINKNITEEDSWKVFSEAFDRVDKDFLKRIKQMHNVLTSNDLRLCAYLRMNLSSKEIAPLLNISVRSVEIKRYRLRKKMDLPHEQGLAEYILTV